jgi:hypothetical protein
MCQEGTGRLPIYVPLRPSHLWRQGAYRYMYWQPAYVEKKLLLKNLVVISSLSLQMRRWLRAYRYLDCTARESLDPNFFGSVRPPYFVPKRRKQLLQFKEPGPFKFTKKHRRLYENSRQFQWYLSTPLLVAVQYLKKCSIRIVNISKYQSSL